MRYDPIGIISVVPLVELKMPVRYKLWLLAAFCLSFLILIQGRELPEARLQIGMHLIQAEVAATSASRAKGLMNRKELDKNQGMLFIFDYANIHAMWMRNTPLPLSVAFMDEHGVIINIAEMKPFTDTTHASSGPAKYALEMNAGWFSERGIKAGDQVLGLPH
jgi:uncharacterized membrane protein (UPF0127 family)